MKSVFAIAATVAAFAAGATAQIDLLPNCAYTCLVPLVRGAGCSITDFACACSAPSVPGPAAECIYAGEANGGCSLEDQRAAAPALVGLCKEYGIDIVIPPNPNEPASSAPAPTGGASSAPAPTGGASSAPAPTGGASSAPAPTGGAPVPQPSKCTPKQHKARKARKN